MAGIDTAIGGVFRGRPARVTGLVARRDGIAWLTSGQAAQAEFSGLSAGRGPRPRQPDRTLSAPIVALSLLAHALSASLVLFPRPSEPPNAQAEASVQLVFEPAPPLPAPRPAAIEPPPAPVLNEPPPPPEAAPAPAPVPPPVAALEVPTVPEVPVRPAPVSPPKRPATPVSHQKPAAPVHVSPRAVAPAEEPQPQVAAASAPLIPPRPLAGMETNRAPPYPETALRRGDQGQVMLRVSVSADGAPVDVELAATSGHPILDEAAVSAVRQWRFSPATRAGLPVPAIAEIPIRFRLAN